MAIERADQKKGLTEKKAKGNIAFCYFLNLFGVVFAPAILASFLSFLANRKALINEPGTALTVKPYLLWHQAWLRKMYTVYLTGVLVVAVTHFGFNQGQAAFLLYSLVVAIFFVMVVFGYFKLLTQPEREA